MGTVIRQKIIKGICIQKRYRQCRVSTTQPPRAGAVKVKKPRGMLSRPTHFPRLDGGNRSATTAKTSGIIAPAPIAPIAVATIRNIKFGLIELIFITVCSIISIYEKP